MGGRQIFATKSLSGPLPIAGLVTGLVLGLLGTGFLVRADEAPVETPPNAPPNGSSVGPGDPGQRPDPGPGRTGVNLERIETELASRLSRIPDEVGVGGSLSATVLGADWERPVAIDGDRSYRLWSVSKPVTALTLRLDGALASDPEVEEKERLALTTSSNCAQRYLTIRLQDLDNGSPEGAVDSFTETLSRGGAELTQAPKIGEPDPSCDQVLAADGVEGAERQGPQFGTAKWTTDQGAQFMKSLGDGDYGPEGSRLLEVMSQAKGASQDPGNQCGIDPGFDWEWGAGNSFGGRKVSFKSGWGLEQETEEFVVSQIAWVDSKPYGTAISVAFLPTDDKPEDQCVTEKQVEVMNETFREIDRILFPAPEQVKRQ